MDFDCGINCNGDNVIGISTYLRDNPPPAGTDINEIKVNDSLKKIFTYGSEEGLIYYCFDIPLTTVNSPAIYDLPLLFQENNSHPNINLFVKKLGGFYAHTKTEIFFRPDMQVQDEHKIYNSPSNH